jgi:ubiquinone/menaquinone biosynthesis C-methylase UbiE
MTLSRAQARRVYDRIGRAQDWQAFYEDPAIELLLAKGGFSGAQAVIEFGCGTGRLAERLLQDHLPADASYLGLDLSPKMIDFAGRRLDRWAPQAKLRLTDGSPQLVVPNEAFDRFVCTYVLDLLCDRDIDAVLDEASRVLTADGLLCLAGLASGRRGAARLVSRGWRAVWSIWPQAVGGCRPLELLDHLPQSDWQIGHQDRVAAWGITSEVVVASPVAPSSNTSNASGSSATAAGSGPAITR